MAEASAFLELLSNPPVVRELRRRAAHSRWNYGDLVDETAKQLLMKGPARFYSLSNPTGYLLGVADRIIKSIDPVSLNRKRQVARESELIDEDQTPDRRTARDLDELMEEVESNIDPEMAPLLDAWLTLPQGKSPVAFVASALGVTQPTARRLVEKTRQTLRKKLKDYQY
jgi:DNA-directed RNA polymerase specialized sigma24 family protein